jgi:glutaredoxin
LTQASSRYPVVIYTAAKCGGCDSARAYLKQRGVPFTEKTVSTDADVAALKKISGGSDTVPLITVGSQKTIGFLQSTVSSLLDDAGYPASSVLPRDYTYPAPVGLTGPSAPAPVTSNNSAAPAAPVNTAPAPIPEAPAPTGNAPPGFKF